MHKEHTESYEDWFNNKTKEIYQLEVSFYGLEKDYFKDMSLEPGTLLHDKLFEALSDHIDHVAVHTNSRYIKFYINNEPDGFAGRFDPKNRVIEIQKEYVNDKSCLLHELIHFYEWSLSETNPIFCEYYLLYLYESLSEKIPDLKERIIKHSELLSLYYKVEESGGKHGILFLLISYKLDLECNYQLGTIFGYDEYAS